MYAIRSYYECQLGLGMQAQALPMTGQQLIDVLGSGQDQFGNVVAGLETLAQPVIELVEGVLAAGQRQLFVGDQAGGQVTG